MAARPVTQADHDAVKELHAQGFGRNEIARRIDRGERTVSRIAEKLGLSFVRSEQTKAATEAKKVDAKARRAALAIALLEDAERLRKQLWEPATVFNFGGKENTYEERELPEPTFSDKRNIMQAIGTAVDRAVKLDEYDRAGDNGGADIDLWLDHMAGGDES
ncbi:MAG: helix-turn-helix domain-containing protein [Hamadaea sp.]|nr:helix-turn-helix domain-containing protein [Hamadaea sp.]